MNNPLLLLLIHQFDENSKAILKSIVDTFESEIVILDTRGKNEAVSVSMDIERQNNSVKILHATKAKALQTGLDYFEKHFKETLPGVILIDMDQNFHLNDIQIILDAMDKIPDALIIGGRGINHKNTRSSTFITSQLSRLTGAKVEDFNSGLRALPGFLISELLNQKSKKTDIWLEMYVQAVQKKTQIIEVPIHSPHNSKSPILISFVLNSSKLIYIFLRFSFLSMVTAGIDYAIFSILFYFSSSILLSIIIARIAAGSFQFFFGKKWVFKSRDKLFIELIKYILLVGILMLVSYLFIEIMVTHFGMNAIISKMIAELSLFIVSFTLQRKIVFAHPTDSKT
jgi:putative flippase GtrA